MTEASSGAGRRLVQAGTVLAWLALFLFFVGLLLAVLPVRNSVKGRTAQDCGAPAAFVLGGRQDVFFTGRSQGFDAGQAKAANGHGCRSLVARRAIPSAGSLLGTLVLGTAAFVLTLRGRRPGSGHAARTRRSV